MQGSLIVHGARHLAVTWILCHSVQSGKRFYFLGQLLHVLLLLPLPAGTKKCFGTCTNTLIDINSCGGCGRTCNKPPSCRTATGASCKSGKCFYPINLGATCTTSTGSTSGICQEDGKCVGE